MTAILRTPAGEPVVVYAVIKTKLQLVDLHRYEDDAVESCSEDEEVTPCHLLPIPEDARTVKREGGADVE